MNDDDNYLDELLELALNRPDDQRGADVWITPEDLVKMTGRSMEELQALVHTGQLAKPEQIGDTLMMGWRSARH